MNEDLEITSTPDETIEEDVNLEDTPADNKNEADKVNSDSSDDTTSKDGNEDDENFLGTFKTKEEADKGFKAAQAKITEQGNIIKELKSKLNIKEQNALPDVNNEIEQVKQKVNNIYNEQMKGLGYKYSSYIPNDVPITQINDIIDNLPPQQAAQFTAELMQIQNECTNYLNSEIGNIHKNANAKYEELKAKDKERYNNGKTGEMIFNAWYNPPNSIDEVAKLFEDYKSLVIEDYIREQAEKQEDDLHKKKLSTNATNSKVKFNNDHIFTREEIGKMSPDEFAKYDAVISKQVAAGLIKY